MTDPRPPADPSYVRPIAIGVAVGVVIGALIGFVKGDIVFWVGSAIPMGALVGFAAGWLRDQSGAV